MCLPERPREEALAGRSDPVRERADIDLRVQPIRVRVHPIRVRVRNQGQESGLGLGILASGFIFATAAAAVDDLASPTSCGRKKN